MSTPAAPGVRPPFTSRRVVMFVTGIAVIVLAGTAFVEESLVSTFMLWALWGTVGTLLLWPESDGVSSRVLRRQFWASFGFRTCGAIALHLALKLMPGWPWWNFGSDGGDELLLWNRSEPFLRAWQLGAPFSGLQLQLDTYSAWMQLLAFSRFVTVKFGPESYLNAKLVLIASGALIVPYVYALALRLFDARVARRAALLAFWLPDYWFYSSTLMRETVVSCVMIMVLYHVAAMTRGAFHWWRVGLALGLNFGVLRYLRNDLAFVNAGMALLFALWSDFTLDVRWIRRLIATAALAVIGLFMLRLVAPDVYSVRALLSDSTFSSGYLQRRFTMESDLALDQASAGSLGAAILRLPAIFAGPLTTVAVLISPFPPWAGDWMRPDVSALQSGITLISGFVWSGIVLFVPVGFFACLRQAPKRTVWAWGPAVTLVLALGLTASIHPRWRLGAMPFLLLVAAVGMLSGRSRRHLLILTVVVLGCGVLLYTVLKLAR